MKLIKFFFSFESFFVLWLFSYQYKNAHVFFNSPDITLVLTFLLIPWGLWICCKNNAKSKLKDPVALVFLGVSLWFIASSFWSPSYAYKLQKTLCYAVYTIPGFLMGYLVIAPDKKRLKRMMALFLVFSVLILAESYRVFWINGLITISDILNTNYLVTGQTLGVGLLVLMPYSYFAFASQENENQKNENKEHKNKWLTQGFVVKINGVVKLHGLWFGSLLLSSLFFYALINLGGRGPVAAASAALVFFYGVKIRQNSLSKPGIHFCILALLCIGSYFTLNGLFEHTGSHFAQRTAPLLTGQIDEAVKERFAYYQSAFRIFLHHPLVGAGWGGWPILHGLGDVSFHPHNIFLEILSETGLIGFFLFMGLAFLVFRNLNAHFIFSTPERASVALIAFFSFLNAQKTGDLHDNLLLFLTLSLCAGIKSWEK